MITTYVLSKVDNAPANPMVTKPIKSAFIREAKNRNMEFIGLEYDLKAL